MKTTQPRPSSQTAARPTRTTIGQEELVEILKAAGADDAACVSLSRAELEEERPHVLSAMPSTRTLVSFCVKMSREAIRAPERSLANHEFHHAGDEIGDIGRQVARELETRGIRALAPPMGFPLEASRFPGRMWVISHKKVAVAAGLGSMGIHRNVIHPRFGSFILLGTLFVDVQLEAEAQPLDYNPCVECKLCVAACPVGAIGADGYFDFSACYSHNYREFMGGFTDWVERLADSKNAKDYRQRVEDPETVSVWQSLSYGANYKAAYCLSVCPAGEEVSAPFIENRGGFVKETLKPLQEKVENVYVAPGSDAEAHVKRRFPLKRVRPVGAVLRPNSIRSFVDGMPLVFQRHQAKGLDCRFHFRFTGEEERDVTVSIEDSKLQVLEGHVGEADLYLRADSRSWVRFLRKELSLPWALLTGRLRLRGQWSKLLILDRVFL